MCRYEVINYSRLDALLMKDNIKQLLQLFHSNKFRIWQSCIFHVSTCKPLLPQTHTDPCSPLSVGAAFTPVLRIRSITATFTGKLFNIVINWFKLKGYLRQTTVWRLSWRFVWIFFFSQGVSGFLSSPHPSGFLLLEMPQMWWASDVFKVCVDVLVWSQSRWRLQIPLGRFRWFQNNGNSHQMWEVKMVVSVYPLFQPDVGIRLPQLPFKRLQLNTFLFLNLYDRILFFPRMRLLKKACRFQAGFWLTWPILAF